MWSRSSPATSTNSEAGRRTRYCTALPTLPWYTCLHYPSLHHPGYTPPSSTRGTVVSTASGVRAVAGETLLGSEASPSLGESFPRVKPAQGCHSSSEILTRVDNARLDKNGQRLDRTRSEWPLITLELDCGGGGPIPWSRGPATSRIT